MLQQFTTSGRSYPVNFGIRALAATADQLGLTLDNLARETVVPDMPFGRLIEIVTVVTAEAMTDGARKSGEPKRYTPDDVVDLIDGDPALLPALLALFRQSIGSGNPVFRRRPGPKTPRPPRSGTGSKRSGSYLRAALCRSGRDARYCAGGLRDDDPCGVRGGRAGVHAAAGV